DCRDCGSHAGAAPARRSEMTVGYPLKPLYPPDWCKRRSGAPAPGLSSPPSLSEGEVLQSLLPEWLQSRPDQVHPARNRACGMRQHDGGQSLRPFHACLAKAARILSQPEPKLSSVPLFLKRLPQSSQSLQRSALFFSCELCGLLIPSPVELSSGGDSLSLPGQIIHFERDGRGIDHRRDAHDIVDLILAEAAVNDHLLVRAHAHLAAVDRAHRQTEEFEVRLA